MKVQARKKVLFFMLGLIFVTVTLLSYSINIQKSISNKVIRLHILANSNSPADQALKIRVRDRILKESTSLFPTVADKKQCESIAISKMSQIISVARDEIKKCGYDYDVDISLKKQHFPVKIYKNFALPSGEYDALRIEIGKGEGENWWCVMFPPLCFVEGAVENPLEGTLTGDELSLTKVNGGVSLRFKTVDFLSASVSSFKTALKK